MRLTPLPTSRLGTSKLYSTLPTASSLLASPRRRTVSPPIQAISIKPDSSKPAFPSKILKNTTRQPLKAFPYIKADPEKLQGAHKPFGLVAFSSLLLSTAVNLSLQLEPDSPCWLPIIIGGTLGAAYVVLNNAGLQYTWRQPDQNLNIVITGGTKGIGKALAREFLRAGDRVLIASRSQTDADAAAQQLSRETGVSISNIIGIACDVADSTSVAHLAEEASRQLGIVDVWINNAGYSGSFKPFIEQSDETIEQVVKTNLLGSLLAMKAAMKLMASQPSFADEGNEGNRSRKSVRRQYHIFNTEGAGSDGMATPNYAAYGATKAGLSQLCKSMQHEAANVLDGNGNSKIGIHNFSPGMVLTDLLLEGATLENKRAFDILCEHPETVAAFLVPRIRCTVARGLSGQHIRYLTVLRALSRFATAPFRLGRFFDVQGNPIFPTEEERLSGLYKKQTERLAKRAARRSSGLGLAYSASIAAAYFILVMDQVAKAHGG
jgi:chlorophyll(ide) b reductase